MYILISNQNPSPQQNFLSAEAWLECPALAFWMACFLRGSYGSRYRWVTQNDVLWLELSTAGMTNILRKFIVGKT